MLAPRSAPDGTWNLTLQSPIGPQDAKLTLKSEGSVLSGSADTPLGDKSFDDGSIDGDQLAWSVKVSKPMPMTVKFQATVDGDAISGTAKAGAFGTFEFTGARAD